MPRTLVWVLISLLLVYMLSLEREFVFATNQGARIVAVELDPFGFDYYSLAKEWIDVTNYGNEPVTLGSLQISSGYTLRISGSTTLNAGESIRVSMNAGTLKDCDEKLLLSDKNGKALDWADNLCDGYDDERYLVGHNNSWKLVSEETEEIEEPTPSPIPLPPYNPSQTAYAIRTEYQPAKSQDLKYLSDSFIQEKIFDRDAELLSNVFELPKDLHLITAECGTANAAYLSEQSTVVLCYELIKEMTDAFGTALEKDASEMALNAFAFVLYHEVGHALIDVYDLDVLGGEEDAVDGFATLLLIWQGDTISAIDAAVWWKLTANQPDETLFADEHSLNQQRFYDILCLIYGSNPDEFSALVTDDLLPQSRAVRCPQEYSQASKSWDHQLSPYIRQGLRQHVEIVFDKDVYSINDSEATISVIAPDANTMLYDKDAIDVFIWSTSDLVGKVLKFPETGPNTGIFEKVVNLKAIKRSTGDTITAEYIPPRSYGAVYAKGVTISSGSTEESAPPNEDKSIPPPTELPPSQTEINDIDVKVTIKQVKDLLIIRVKGYDVNNMLFTSEPVTSFIMACKSKGWQTITCTEQVAKFETKSGLEDKQIFLIKISNNIDSIAWNANIWDGDILVKGKQGTTKVLRQ